MFRKLNILILCERSQTEVAAFADLGHHALSVDLQKCTRGSRYRDLHYIGDAYQFLYDTPANYWDLIIAHPPCTYLSNVSCQHLHRNPQRWTDMYNGLDFFNSLWTLACQKSKHVCFENPRPHRFASYYLPPVSDVVCPSFFGSSWSKRTYLWLYNLPPLIHGLTVLNPRSFTNSRSGSNSRSKSFPELASAMAQQYTHFILHES